MSETSKDAGVIAALMERLEKQRLPRALAMQEKVAQGEVLDDVDIQFLETVFHDAGKMQPLLARHPEYRTLVSRMVSLYKEITQTALENEKKHSAP